jgi:hypothetical protein
MGYINMNGFYLTTQSLHKVFTAKGFRVITLGDNYKLDIAKQTIFPYAHIVPGSSTKSGNTTTYDFEIFCLDLVDFNKDNLRDQLDNFFTTDNMQDVLNDIHNRLDAIIEQYERGAEFDLHIVSSVDDDKLFEPLIERFENVLTGWQLSISLTVPTGASIC